MVSATLVVVTMVGCEVTTVVSGVVVVSGTVVVVSRMTVVDALVD